MIFTMIPKVLATIYFINSCIAQRRIRGGTKLVLPMEAKSYMVYIVKALESNKEYDHWLCGGALVSESYVVTSAACVEDVEYMYAIAGSLSVDRYYLENTCKRKIIMTCVPKDYHLEYKKIQYWAYADIALAKLEKKLTPEHCWGNPIEINYEPSFQEPGTNVVTFGYGSLENWRRTNETSNNNSGKLHYLPLVIYGRRECKEYYSKNTKVQKLIDKYMICTVSGGKLDHSGNIIKPSEKRNGCTYPKVLRDGFCILPEIRKDLLESKNISHDTNISICQNDHGGPLVTWIGAKTVLLGVASLFRINGQYKCEGPNLFTSTQCNGKFLDCVLNDEDPTRMDHYRHGPVMSRRRFNGDCNDPTDMGFEIVRRQISWRNHPDGPAEDELHVDIRPQLSLIKLRAQEEQLGSEEEQLRSKEEQLRSEEEQLRSEKEELRSEQERLRFEQAQLRSEQERLRYEQAQLRSEQERFRSEQLRSEQLRSEQDQIRSEEKHKILI